MPNHNCETCSLNNEQFKADVLKGIASLQADMKSLIGNGQPGRIGKLEKKVDDHSTKISLIIGGLILASALLGVVKLFL